jgi:MFS family permease
VLAVVSAAQFLVTLDLWVVNIALPALQRDFAPVTLSEVSWILDVYAIVLAALLLLAGRAADSIGRRKCFLAGLVVFGIASLGCAVAPDLLALIACRALQAAGAAVLLPTSLGLALSVFPARQRGTAVGVWAAVGAVAAGSGAVLGGLLVESSWRWIFLINLPIILAALAAGVAILPRRPGVPAGQRTGRRVDRVGTVLVLGAVGANPDLRELGCRQYAPGAARPPARQNQVDRGGPGGAGDPGRCGPQPGRDRLPRLHPPRLARIPPLSPRRRAERTPAGTGGAHAPDSRERLIVPRTSHYCLLPASHERRPIWTWS